MSSTQAAWSILQPVVGSKLTEMFILTPQPDPASFRGPADHSKTPSVANSIDNWFGRTLLWLWWPRLLFFAFFALVLPGGHVFIFFVFFALLAEWFPDSPYYLISFWVFFSMAMVVTNFFFFALLSEWFPSGRKPHPLCCWVDRASFSVSLIISIRFTIN